MQPPLQIVLLHLWGPTTGQSSQPLQHKTAQLGSLPGIGISYVLLLNVPLLRRMHFGLRVTICHGNGSQLQLSCSTELATSTLSDTALFA